MNIEKIKSEICGYIDSCKVLSKQGIIKFVESLSSDLFLQRPASGYKILVIPQEGDKKSFIDFMISCGFGDESGFWSNAEEVDGGILFDTSKSMICEFIVKDGLKRRYSIALDDIPLEDGNIKRISLGTISTAQYHVSFVFDGMIDDEVESDSASSASYDYRYKVQGKDLYGLLGISDRGIITELSTTRGDIPSVTGQLESGNYSISYPIHGRAVVCIKSEDSSNYIVLRKAIESLVALSSCSGFHLTKYNFEKSERYE